jgi:hypothetical protein
MHQTKSVLALVISLCLLVPALVGWRKPDGNMPLFLTTPSSIQAGATINVYLEMDQASVGDTTVTITPSSSTTFSSIPATVTVPNGQTTLTFQATVTSSASGMVSVLAEANGGSARSYPALIYQ